MFGNTIDYHILKPLTHSRGLATEAELATGHGYTLDDASAYADKARKLYFDNRFPIDPTLSYLDLGCGPGKLSIGLSLAGANDITGLDAVSRSIAQANAVAKQLPASGRPNFLNVSSHEFKTERQYDVVIALAVMEHTRAPDLFLREIHDLLKPNGRAFVSITPFNGPFGDHMNSFFKARVPWRGLIFSEQAVLRLRAERFRPNNPAKRYQDIIGGLNLMTITEYLRYIDEAGLDILLNNFDPHFRHHKHLWPMYPLSYLLTRIPKVRDYFTLNLYSVLRRQDGDLAAPSVVAERLR